MLVPSLTLTACVAAVSLAVGIGSGGYAMSVYADRKALALHAKVQQATVADAIAERTRAKAYAEWVRKQRPKTIIVEREVQRALESHRNWSDAPIPGGLRESLDSAASRLGAADPPGAVPAAGEPQD